MLCAMGEEVFMGIVFFGLGSVAGCCVLCVRKSGWMLCAVGEGVWLDDVCCG